MRECVFGSIEWRMEAVFVGGDRRPFSETRCTTGYCRRISLSLGSAFGTANWRVVVENDAFEPAVGLVAVVLADGRRARIVL